MLVWKSVELVGIKFHLMCYSDVFMEVIAMKDIPVSEYLPYTDMQISFGDIYPSGDRRAKCAVI